MVIPKFSSEAKEAAWWDAHRAEVEADIRARLTNLAERTAADINERANAMNDEKRAWADSETKKIAARVRRRTS
ncbi:MAG: hypothetical protein ABSB14_11320 [Candidatus Sulfotelmatobacter sp.]